MRIKPGPPVEMNALLKCASYTSFKILRHILLTFPKWKQMGMVRKEQQHGKGNVPN